MIYYIVDCEFNQAHYSDIIGLMYSTPPSYAILKTLPNPFRKHECWKCNTNWIAKVKFSKTTPNLSGEQMQSCPKCHTKSSCASSWIQSDDNPYPFPEPIKPKE